MKRKRIKAFGIEIDVLSMDSSVEECLAVARKRGDALPYVVTPNLDHIVNLQTSRQFRRAHDGAALVLTDGNPVRRTLSLLGHDIKETVPGSDLVPAIFTKVVREKASLNIFLLGAAPGVAERAAVEIESEWQGVGRYLQPAAWV